MTWWRRLRNLDRLERELDAELRYHFDRQVDDNIRAGMSESEARRLARLDFGGDDQLKEIDLKTGAQGKGAVALMIDRSTVAHVRDLRVEPLSSK